MQHRPLIVVSHRSYGHDTARGQLLLGLQAFAAPVKEGLAGAQLQPVAMCIIGVAPGEGPVQVQILAWQLSMFQDLRLSRGLPLGRR